MPQVSRVAAVVSLAMTLCFLRANAGESDLADFAVKTSGVNQGLCLVLGDEDGKVTAALAKCSRMYVQGCTWNDRSVQASRKLIVDSGNAERSSIAFCESNDLPYADGLINLLVCDKWGARPMDAKEILRVMAPGGIALLGNDAQLAAGSQVEAAFKAVGVKECKALSRPGWVQVVKPIDPGLGGWTQLAGAADMSWTNDDTVVGPWEEVRWIGDPRWGSLYISYGGVVSAGGRLYYKENRSADGGTQSFLVARDAFNGFELWRQACGPAWKSNMVWVDETLTCDDRRVYILEEKALVAREGATGKKIRDYAIGFSPVTVSSTGGFLVASGRTRALALDKESGKVKWERPCTLHPAVSEGAAYILSAKELEATDLTSGTTRWKVAAPPTPAGTNPKVFAKAGVVYVMHAAPYKPANVLYAFDAKSGAQLWKKEDTPSSYGIFPIRDEVWMLRKSNAKTDNLSVLVVEARTGNTKREFAAKGQVSSHCNPTKASANFILYNDSWYLDTKTETSYGLKTVRTPCRIGHCPAQGMTYFLPHHCNCSISLRGLLAMSPAGAKKWFSDANKEGETKLFTAGSPSANLSELPDDWPMYRKDPQRSNGSSGTLSDKLKQLWAVKVGNTALSQATFAYGMAYMAEATAHRVIARDAATGKEAWSFVADGRVNCPPALHRGLCLFASDGGSVFALDARTGNLVWRLRAAPVQKYIAEEGQFASSWPVVGGVLPMDGVIYFTCGRSSTPDGLWLMAVETATGKVLWRKRGGSTGDMFSSDGKSLFLMGNSFTCKEGKALGSAASGGVLQTTTYLGQISIVDFMACVDPALANNKHCYLTDGQVRGENLAFNQSLSVSAFMYCFHMPEAMKKKGRDGDRFLYAAEGKKNRWVIDENINQQMLGLVLVGNTIYAAGIPVSRSPSDKPELWILAGADGKRLQTLTLAGAPTYDGLSVAGSRLYLTTEDGQLICFGP